jgi:hypothetical protein
MTLRLKSLLTAACVALTTIVTLSSCDHKDLCYHSHRSYGKLHVVYDWQKAPEADPEIMMLYFYKMDDDAASPYIYSFKDCKGGTIELPNGTYRVITYNGNSDAVFSSYTDSFSGHLLYTREASIIEPSTGYSGYSSSNVPRTPQSANEPVRITGDQMWAYVEVGIVVDINEDEEQTITLYPEEVACHYTYEIRNVENLTYAVRMNAALTGMSGVYYPAQMETDDTPTTLTLESYWSLDTNRIFGEFYTFGRCDVASVLNQMELYVWSSDGAQHAYGTTGNDAHFDVTDQVVNAPDPRNVHIIIDGLTLYKPENGGDGGGYDITVDNWDEENHDIYL